MIQMLGTFFRRDHTGAAFLQEEHLFSSVHRFSFIQVDSIKVANKKANHLVYPPIIEDISPILKDGVSVFLYVDKCLCVSVCSPHV